MVSRSFFERPAQLGHLLADIVRRRGVAEKTATRELNTLWSQVAGDRVARHSFVRKLRNGVLEIGVKNGTVLEELSSYLKHDLLQAIQNSHADRGIRSLKFVRVA